MGGARRRVPRSVPYIWVAKVREFRRPRSVGKGKRGEKNEENREHGSEISVTMRRKGERKKDRRRIPIRSAHMHLGEGKGEGREYEKEREEK